MFKQAEEFHALDRSAAMNVFLCTKFGLEINEFVNYRQLFS
jgi:hypothetical protein